MSGSKAPHGIIYGNCREYIAESGVYISTACREYIAESGVYILTAGSILLSQGCIFGNKRLSTEKRKTFVFAMEGPIILPRPHYI